MRFLIVCVVWCLFGAPTITWAKIYDRCSLARSMYAMDVPKSDLPRWTCIAEHESHYNSTIVSKPNKNGTKDWGIFQINDKYWCDPQNGQKSYNQCNINCQDLLVDNIDGNIKCAKKIKRMQGWDAWTTLKFCKGPLPIIDDCFRPNKN